jgi:carotenoid cleavage dioxygenase-like enzyme
MATTTLKPIDPSTVETLSGRFAPVHVETEVASLQVEGSLPPDLGGSYVRNGPNPMFDPLGSYTYPLEGDGMLHAVTIENGKASYRNRWVRTQGLVAEERAGRALFGGLMTPAFVDESLLGDDPDPGLPFKLNAFVNIVRHNGHLVALEEGMPGYEVSSELQTLGRFDFDGALPLGITAHPKVDPITGEMVVFRYDTEQPYLTWAVVDPNGSVLRGPTEVKEVERGYMVHDFSVTEHHAVFILGPGVLDLEAPMRGQSPLQWRPELGTRVVVVPRDGVGPNITFDLDAFWAWHFANAFEADGRITIDFPWWSSLGNAGSDFSTVTGAFSRLVLDPASGASQLTHLDDTGTEFPRIDDRLLGRQHRYLTVVASTGRSDLKLFEHDRLSRWDMQAGSRVSYDSDACLGEVVFAPRPGGTDELDGYYMTFANSLDDGRSWLYVWDAASFPAPPRARVLIPTRVPNGIHGNWFVDWV